MEIKKKELYLSPEVHIFEVKSEGVICVSFTGLRDDVYGEFIDPWAV